MLNPYARGASSTATVYAASTALGIPLPAEVADAAERTATVVSRLSERPNGQGDTLTLAVIAAVEAGTDPAADPEVQRVLAARDLDGLVMLPGIVSDTLAELERETIRLYAPELVDSWRPAFDAAATKLAECHQALDGTPLADTETVVRLGPAASAAWASAQDAAATIDRIHASWSALHNLVMGTEVRVFRMLAIADINPKRWLSSDLDEKPADPWDALGRGLSLRLPTVVDFTEQAAAIRSAIKERDEAEADRAAERRPALDLDFINRVEDQRREQAEADRLAEAG